MTEALPELRDPTPAERPSAVAAPVEPAKPAKSAEERSEIARKAAQARWNKRTDWETVAIDEGLTLLAELRAESEKAGSILQRRVSEIRVSEVHCYNPDCNKLIDVGSGRFAGKRDRRNVSTGLPESAYACSAACWLYVCKHFTTTGT